MKKFTLVLSTLIASNLLTDGAFSQSQYEKDVDGSVQSVTQIINEEVNMKFPNTDSSTYIAPHIDSRDQIDPVTGERWGETKKDSYFVYQGKIDGAVISNCDLDENGVCATTASKTVQAAHPMAVPASYSMRSSGFITAEPPVVKGTGDYADYFFRYWDDACDVDKTNEAAEGCWSPSLPKVCTDTLAKSNLFAAKDAEQANKAILGDKTRDLANAKNAYSSATTYTAGVKLELHVPANDTYLSKSPEGFYEDRSLENDGTTLPVQKWVLDSDKKCLKPDFNYTIATNDKKTQVLGKDGVVTSNLSSVTGVSTEMTTRLPCGMFEESNNLPEGYMENMDTGDIECKPGYARFIKGVDGTEYYTQYNITIDGDENSNQKINLRGCVMCQPVNTVCDQLVAHVLNQHNCNPGSCTEDQLNNAVKFLRTAEGFALLSGYTAEQANNKEASNRYEECLTCGSCLDSVETGIKLYLGL